ncbi:Vacuolar membrane amino acid uptake transporter fnx2 [Mycena indigotica]|uniref:Vacuolar membrane amino acid uptake transporter fnx2 n=1 Tax=Mycena indigotica TaxID=2126181 RepID=A0A8H6VYY1_9AGAR|nr:Vacuolar membrane amino acid uptake transporter fnx2 [Mycena indigotica]KAF7296971.1 Vacuolar membrane amino acid uptake transporter fnx2 [Mycena indigotica]
MSDHRTLRHWWAYRVHSELIVARGLTGIGGGGMSTVVSIIMSDIVPLRSRGTWQGVLNIIYAAGSATGAPLGGFLSDSIGWRWGFLVQVPAVVLAFLSVSFALHLPPTTTSNLRNKLARVDFSGALSLVLTVFLLLFGLDRGGNMSWSSPLTITTLSLSVAFFITFASIELFYAAEPFAPRRIIAHPSLIYAYFVNFFGLMAGFSAIFHIALFYQAVMRMPPAEVGWWMVPSVVAGVIGSLGGGLWIQSTGKYYWATVYAYLGMVVGMVGTTISAGLVAKSAVGVAVGSFVVAVGNGMGVTTSLIALISNAGAADQAIATAVSYLFRSLGSVVGLSIGSAILQLTLRRILHRTLGADGDIDVDEITGTRQVRASLTYIDTLPPHIALLVREAYERAVLNTILFSTTMSVGALVAAVGIHEKKITPGTVSAQPTEEDDE